MFQIEGFNPLSYTEAPEDTLALVVLAMDLVLGAGVLFLYILFPKGATLEVSYSI